ncbi:MAG: hypothetical protein IT328_20200 [Caldilineaceae bacterium]|nr:hypothetical protein [Caldilineaceae bacterium]
MSGIPSGEVTQTANSPQDIKLKTAAAIVRTVQEMSPVLDKARLMAQELTDVVTVYGGVTDEELAALGVDTATITSLASFLTSLVAFMDADAANRENYRTIINSIKRISARL